MLFGLIEYGWSTYPSTNLSSSLLFAANVVTLVGVWLGDAEGRGKKSVRQVAQGGRAKAE